MAANPLLKTSRARWAALDVDSSAMYELNTYPFGPPRSSRHALPEKIARTGKLGCVCGPRCVFSCVMHQSVALSALLVVMSLPASSVLAQSPAIPENRRVTLSSVASRHSLSVTPPLGTCLFMSSLSRNMVFEIDSRKITVDGTVVWLNDEVASSNGQWTICSYDAVNTVLPLFVPSYAINVLPRKKPLNIVIDPGHGGVDSGATVQNEIEEKVWCLDVALRVAKRLKDAGLSPHLTRDKDIAVALPDRAAFARRRQADAFISIHLNAADNRQVSGTETFVLTGPGFASTSDENGSSRVSSAYPGNKYDQASIWLAMQVHQSVNTATSATDRGIKRARFEVLRLAPCPAILLECGFTTHSVDRMRLSSDRYQEVVADAIARGIIAYTAALSQQTIVTPTTTTTTSTSTTTTTSTSTTTTTTTTTSSTTTTQPPPPPTTTTTQPEPPPTTTTTQPETSDPPPPVCDDERK